MGIAAELKRARKASGLTQEQAAERAEIRQEQISRIERGLRNPPLADLDRLADAYGVRWIAAPAESAAEPELAVLQPDHREILLRLARLLPLMSPDRVRDLVGDIERWSADYLADSPTSQDSRASAS